MLGETKGRRKEGRRGLWPLSADGILFAVSEYLFLKSNICIPIADVGTADRDADVRECDLGMEGRLFF